jgi:hypothetical protein
MRQLCREGSCSYPGRSARLCDHQPVVALHVVMHEVIGQKSADGIVVDSLMKRRPEAKRGDHPSSSVLSCGRPAALRANRRVDGLVKSTININGLLNIHWSDYGPALLVIAQCGPACWVMWEGGDSNPFLSSYMTTRLSSRPLRCLRPRRL